MTTKLLKNSFILVLLFILMGCTTTVNDILLTIPGDKGNNVEDNNENNDDNIDDNNDNNEDNNNDQEEEEEEVIEEPTAIVYLTEYERDLLARIVHAEAGNQSYNGKVAVANVILNRLLSDQYPNTLYGVIYQYNQFEPVSNGTINYPASQESIDAAMDALYGNYVVPEYTLYFWAYYVPETSWVWTREVVVVIGDHIFGTNP